MKSPSDRSPIIVADAGPLIRLAAAGLLDSVRGLNRQIVLVDRVEDELISDLTKPFAAELADWIARMGPAILRAATAIGVGIATLRARERSAEEDEILKSALRDSGELALREFLSRWRPTETASAIIIYEDRMVPNLFLAADYPLTLMTTQAFISRMHGAGAELPSSRWRAGTCRAACVPSPRLRGEGQDEGRRLAPAQAAAPHPGPLPASGERETSTAKLGP